MTDFEKLLCGQRLNTVEIIYHLPDYPNILQTFVWQEYGIAPSYPRLKKFLDFWSHNIDGVLHSIRLMSSDNINPSECRFADIVLNMH